MITRRQWEVRESRGRRLYRMRSAVEAVMPPCPDCAAVGSCACGLVCADCVACGRPASDTSRRTNRVYLTGRFRRPPKYGPSCSRACATKARAAIGAAAKQSDEDEWARMLAL